MDIFTEYRRIVGKEFELRGGGSLNQSLLKRSAEEIFALCVRLLEIAESSLVPRSYLKKYRLDDANVVFESVGAHTNLVEALVELALMYGYGPMFGEAESEYPKTLDGYAPRVIYAAVRLHDLPENQMGDIPDDGKRDEKQKKAGEIDYLRRYLKLTPTWAAPFYEQVRKLLLEMEERSSMTGQLLYAADKMAALVITLACDKAGYFPMMNSKDVGTSERDREEMERCDPWSDFTNWHRASEMWAMDFLSIRKLNQYDDTGFFTAVLVMMTLMVNGRWYGWREKEYLN